MRKGYLGLLAGFLASTAPALAQPVPTTPSPKTDAPATAEVLPAPWTLPPDSTEGGRSLPPDGSLHDDPPPGPEWPCWQAPLYSSPRFWVEGDYLHWWIKNGPLSAPLVTTGAVAPLGTPGTSVLFGGSGLDYESLSGARFTLGGRLNPEGTFAIEASGFFLEEGSINFAKNSDEVGSPILSRPIVNAQTNNETAVLISEPTRFAGGIDISSTSQLWGAEANLRANLLGLGETGLDLLLGFRYLSLDEDLDIASRSTVLSGGTASFLGNPVGAGNTLVIRDSFDTRNRFYGGQIGARGAVRRGRWLVDATAKVAFGGVQQEIRVNGSTTLVPPTGPTSAVTGGVLALPTNIGRRSSSDGAVIPEGRLRIGYQFTEHLSAHLGYTVIFWDNVVRPGDQITRTVNLTQVPSSQQFAPLTGPRQPAPLSNDSRFWAQGIDVGIAFRY